MSHQCQYDFEELPLIVRGNLQAGLISGTALLNYWPDGTWGISELYLDGFQPAANPRGFVRQPYPLERGTFLHTTILDRLSHGEWFKRAQDFVNNTIDEERENAA